MLQMCALTNDKQHPQSPHLEAERLSTVQEEPRDGRSGLEASAGKHRLLEGGEPPGEVWRRVHRNSLVATSLMEQFVIPGGRH